MKPPVLMIVMALGGVLIASCDRDAVGTGSNRPNAQSSQSNQIPSSQQGVSAQTSFDLADQNDDGSISIEEAGTVADLDFAAADADKNAALSLQEYRTAIEKARPRG